MFFLYADGLIEWYPYSYVFIGIYHYIYSGTYGVNHYPVFYSSHTPYRDIVIITRTSNINQPGLWVLKMDGNIIAGV